MPTQEPNKPGTGRVKAPLEAPVEKLLEPFAEFARAQTTGGFILIGATVLAIYLASSDAGTAYESLKHHRIGFRSGELVFEKSLVHWVNEGLMAGYFFLLGLEIKRELLVGQFANPRRAITVVAAASGGIILPAVAYLAINGGTGYSHGWGIPVATDTAFALAVLVFLRRHVPPALRAFLVGLAIVDDLGAIAIIALVYTTQIDVGSLLVAAGLLVLCGVCNIIGVRRPSLYGVLGVGVWIAIVGSGIHGTIAGVLMASLAPVRPAVKQYRFVEFVRHRIRRFDKLRADTQDSKTAMLEKDALQSTAEEIRDAAVKVTAPLRRWEKALDYPMTLLVLPLFAFLNAGLQVSGDAVAEILAHPVALGIAFGLVIGKPGGVLLGTYIAVRTGFSDLPKGMTFGHVAGAGLLAGIGFTMSVFIGGLAFAGGSSELAAAKGGILASSILAATAAVLWLRFLAKRKTHRRRQ